MKHQLYKQIYYQIHNLIISLLESIIIHFNFVLMSFSTSCSIFDSENHSTNIGTHRNFLFLLLEPQKTKNKTLIEKVSFFLLQIICVNHKQSNYRRIIKKQSKQIFSCRELPNICLSDYLNRIIEYTKLEQSTLIASLIYIDRFCHKNSIFLTEYNTLSLLFSSIMVSLKFNEDTKFTNTFYSIVGGMSKKNINKLEREFLFGIDFNLFITIDTYKLMEKSLFNNSIM